MDDVISGGNFSRSDLGVSVQNCNNRSGVKTPIQDILNFNPKRENDNSFHHKKQKIKDNAK